MGRSRHNTANIRWWRDSSVTSFFVNTGRCTGSYDAVYKSSISIFYWLCTNEWNELDVTAMTRHDTSTRCTELSSEAEPRTETVTIRRHGDTRDKIRPGLGTLTRVFTISAQRLSLITELSFPVKSAHCTSDWTVNCNKHHVNGILVISVVINGNVVWNSKSSTLLKIKNCE